MKTLKFKITILATLAFVIGFEIVSAWTGPTSAPPTPNVSAPVNVSTDFQLKEGSFRSATDVRAPKYFDYPSTSYYMDPADGDTGSKFNRIFSEDLYSVGVYSGIFYDWNDPTNYYVNPNGVSKLSSLTVGGQNVCLANGTNCLGSGDITAVTAGTGLTGGGTTGAVTLSANTSYLQRLVSGSCEAGSSIRVISSTGTVICETDDNTTYPYAVNSVGNNGQVWKSDGSGVGVWGTDNVGITSESDTLGKVADRGATTDQILNVAGLTASGKISNYGTAQYSNGMSTYVLNTQHLYPSDNNASQTMYLGISNPIDVRGYVFNSSSHFRVSDSMMVDSTFYMGTSASDTDDMYIADRIYDWDNTGYYLDINGASRMGAITPDSISLGGVSRTSWPTFSFTETDNLQSVTNRGYTTTKPISATNNSYGVYGKDGDNGTYGYLGKDNYGVFAYGNTGFGVYGSGRGGVYGYGSDWGVYGADSNNGTSGYLGYGGYGVYTTGTVQGGSFQTSSTGTIQNSNQFYCNNGSNCHFNYSGSGRTYVGNAAGTTILGTTSGTFSGNLTGTATYANSAGTATTVTGYQNIAANRLYDHYTGSAMYAYNGRIYNGWLADSVAVNYANSANSATYATYINTDSFNMKLHWIGQSGQPTYLWGSNNGSDAYVWNPSNFSVNYANYSGGVSQYPNRIDNAWYQINWNNAAAGDRNLYSSANIKLRSSGYGAIGWYGGAWWIEGNASYGLYSNTGLNAAGGLWDAGNRVYSAINPPPSSGGISGSGSTYYVPKFTGSTSLGNSQIYDNGTNVGIGTTATNQKLHVNGGAWISSGVITNMIWDSDNIFGYYVDPSGTSSLKTANFAGVVAANAGITVDNQTVIDDGGGWHRTYGQTGWYNQTYGGGIYMTDPTWVQTFNNKSFYSSATIQAGANMYSPRYYDLDNSSYYLDPYSNSYLNMIYIKNYALWSDRSMKKDIEELEGSLGKILNLKGVSFKWKDEENGIGEDIGLIAQDVEKIYPEIVSTDEKTGLKAVQYSNLVAPLIEAIKEQQQQINELKNEIEILKNK